MTHYKALSIAGFDASGGAGIQADLKTFSALGCYGMTVLTALPIQNTTGVKGCYEIPLQAIEDQLTVLFDDIRPDSIKIGMLFNTAIIELVAAFLKKNAQGIPLVVDPVTVAKSGDPLLLPEAIVALTSSLLPLATVITPNLPEAATLTQMPLSSKKDMLPAARRLLDFGSQYVLLKGGHLEIDRSDDLLLGEAGLSHWFEAPRIQTKNTHGTGCTLSAAIAAYLAQKKTVPEACALAKDYLSQAIAHAKDDTLGRGHGPVHHFYHIWPYTTGY